MAFTILVVDDDLMEQKILQAVLMQLGNYHLIFANNGGAGLILAEQIEPDLIMLDYIMPGMNGIEVCKKVRAQPALAEVPILMLTGAGDKQVRLDAIKAGVDDFLIKPYDPVELSARIHTIARLNRYRHLREERSRFEALVELALDGIVIVDSGGTVLFTNPVAAQQFSATAGGNFPNFTYQQKNVGWEDLFLAEEILKNHLRPFEVVFQADGSPTCVVEMSVQSMEWDADVIYLVWLHDVTARKQAEDDLRQLNLTLEQRVEARTAELQYLSTHDSLTHLYNRAFFESELCRLTHEHTAPCSLLVLDIDGLKQVNDQRGHADGDALIVCVAEGLRLCFEERFTVARVGGDEFVVLLPNTDEPALLAEIDCMEHALLQARSLHPGLPAHISVGGATAYPGDDLNDSLRIADARMYAQKREKKHRAGD